MPWFRDMINGHEWRQEAEYNQRVARAAQTQNVQLQGALYDSHGMLREQRQRSIQANRRAARRSFREGYDAALEQVGRDMELMRISYEQGHRDGRRDSRRQIDDGRFDRPEPPFRSNGYGPQYGISGFSSTQGYGGHRYPQPPGHGVVPPPWSPHQDAYGQGYYGNERQDAYGQGYYGNERGGSRAPMPQRARSPPNHARRIEYGRDEWQQQMPGRRQQWRGRAETEYGSDNGY